MEKIRLSQSRLRHYGAVLASCLLVGSCASHSTITRETTVNSQKSSGRSDPLERFNRVIWRFNYDILDPLLLRPVAVVWRDYFPQPARHVIRNVLSNLDEPATAVNYVLQAQFAKALRHLGRFLINTVGGLGGIVDIATLSGLPKESPYQFGDVLGYYRIGQGPYMMLPGYGPTTPRQLLGRIPDHCYFPLAYLTLWSQAGKWLLEGVETRAGLLSKEAVLQSSSDDYLTLREAYLQWRAFIIEESRAPQEPDPDHLNHQRDLDYLD